MKGRWKGWLGLLAVGVMGLSGCTPGQSAQPLDSADLVFSMDCPAEIRVGEQTYQGVFRYDPSQIASLTLESPDALRGWACFWEGDGFRMTYEGLSVQEPECPLPGGVAVSLVETLNAAQKTDRLLPLGNGVFQGQWQDASFTLTADPKTGAITALSLPRYELEAVFSSEQPVLLPLEGEEIYAEHP